MKNCLISYFNVLEIFIFKNLKKGSYKIGRHFHPLSDQWMLYYDIMSMKECSYHYFSKGLKVFVCFEKSVTYLFTKA